MSAYRYAFALDANSSEERLALAGELLDSGAGVVLFEGVVALRPTPTQLLCEVIDRLPGERRCQNEFEVLIENGQRLLEASKLGAFLPDLPRRWLVVEDYGSGTSELWHGP